MSKLFTFFALTLILGAASFVLWMTSIRDFVKNRRDIVHVIISAYKKSAICVISAALIYGCFHMCFCGFDMAVSQFKDSLALVATYIVSGWLVCAPFFADSRNEAKK
jgi:hypothetical protein